MSRTPIAASASKAPNGQNAPLWQVLLRPVSREETNQRNVLIDAVGVGITAGVGSFLSVFLVRLGATPFQVGLLTAMPALTGMLLSIPVGEFLAHKANIVPWFARSRFLVLSSYVLTGLVPFLVLDHQPEAVIFIWALATLPQTVVSVAFTVVMGGVAGPGGRLTLMSRRWAILGLTNSLTVLIVGQILEKFSFPLNYQVVFIGSAVGALIRVIFSSSLKMPPQEVPEGQVGLVQALREYGGAIRRHKPFSNFLTAQFVFRWGMAFAVPLLPIYWVRSVGATDAQISMINSANTFVMMLSYFFWAHVAARKGERPVLLISAFGVSFYPLMTALTHSPGLLPLWAALAGFFVGGTDLVFFDVVLATCPKEHQATYIGIYQTTLQMATFLAPLVGTELSNVVGLVPALILATVFRLAGAVMLKTLGVGKGI
ncbi:MAG: MFS transporter [Nitrososphaerales archaeon]